MTRGADRLMAVLLMALAAACLVHLYLLPGGKDFGLTAMHEPWATQLVAFSLLAFACLVGAVLFWAGLLPGQPTHLAGTPLFGRAAEAQETGRPGLRKIFFALPLIVLAALAVDRVGPALAPDRLPRRRHQPQDDRLLRGAAAAVHRPVAGCLEPDRRPRGHLHDPRDLHGQHGGASRQPGAGGVRPVPQAARPGRRGRRRHDGRPRDDAPRHGAAHDLRTVEIS